MDLKYKGNIKVASPIQVYLECTEEFWQYSFNYQADSCTMQEHEMFCQTRYITAWLAIRPRWRATNQNSLIICGLERSMFISDILTDLNKKKNTIFALVTITHNTLNYQEGDIKNEVLKRISTVSSLFNIDNLKLSNITKSEYISDNLPNEITIVTAYFDLGTFKKGKFLTFNTDTYKEWMKSYGMLNNTVIMFTDSQDIADLIQKSRKHFTEHMTRVIQIDRNSLWAFKLAPKIRNIFKQPGYPVFSPNTINENYSCVMHAKYDLLEKVIKDRLYDTKYLAWVDIGYFRNHYDQPFKLLPPNTVKDDHISFVQVHEFHPWLTHREIISGNCEWIAGGFFMGRPEYLLIFIEDYKTAVLQLIEQKWMSTDQQVLYSIFAHTTELISRIPLQTHARWYFKDWFYLEKICREEWEKKVRSNFLNLIKILHYLL
ncbi:hypothetical protein KUTeg_002567 [Tegillarca granosa]|uniref:Uncharacterized protein n=1 Tax=Tegillarca granosa TaxID=220873 RepID=A0ABQ9FXJ5_TEGGR|nr:hypothetical protein KUTeg_002567 [Tegillarca granosa]